MQNYPSDRIETFFYRIAQIKLASISQLYTDGLLVIAHLNRLSLHLCIVDLLHRSNNKHNRNTTATAAAEPDLGP